MSNVLIKKNTIIDSKNVISVYLSLISSIVSQESRRVQKCVNVGV